MIAPTVFATSKKNPKYELQRHMMTALQCILLLLGADDTLLPFRLGFRWLFPLGRMRSPVVFFSLQPVEHLPLGLAGGVKLLGQKALAFDLADFSDV